MKGTDPCYHIERARPSAVREVLFPGRSCYVRGAGADAGAAWAVLRPAAFAR